MSDTSEKVAMAIRNERRFACVMDCKCDDRQLAEAAIAAMVAARWAPLSAECTYCGNEYPMPKLSAEALETIRLALNSEEVRLGLISMRTYTEMIRSIRAARAELEALP